MTVFQNILTEKGLIYCNFTMSKFLGFILQGSKKFLTDTSQVVWSNVFLFGRDPIFAGQLHIAS